jgi:hypothetical protein
LVSRNPSSLLLTLRSAIGNLLLGNVQSIAFYSD